MMKTLVSSTTLVLLLCAPAMAQPATPAVKPPDVPMTIDLVVKIGTETRNHRIVISEDSCGHVQAKSKDFEDDIRVCSVPKRGGYRIEASWKVREKLHEVHMSYTAAVARGGTVETFGPNGVRFTLGVK